LDNVQSLKAEAAKMKSEETRVVSLHPGLSGPEDEPSLDAIATRLRDFRTERKWERFHTPRSLAVSIAIEAGELLEQFQWVSDDDVDEHVRERRDSIQEELADVAIYLVQLSDVLGISLGEAIEGKISLNESRYPAAAARGSSRKYTELADEDPLAGSGR
jgi:dCTP diphosphatase